MGAPVMWFEVIGQDRERLQDFYSELFGWKLNVMEEMNYAMVDNGGQGIDGGIGAPPPGGQIEAHGTTWYVQVDDLQAALDKAEELGGKTVMPPTDLPQVSLALFDDPEGHRIGLMKPQG